jgi:cell division protein ZapA
MQRFRRGAILLNVTRAYDELLSRYWNGSITSLPNSLLRSDAMAEVRIEVGGRFYKLACRDGEENHLRAMGALVAARAADAERVMGPMSENRLLLFSALLLADSLNENGTGSAEPWDGGAAVMLERMAERVEALAESLETGRPTS